MSKLRIAFFVILLTTALQSLAGELEDRHQIERHVASLFAGEKFDELEKLADEYRRTEARTSSGLWKLTIFYSGFRPDGNIKDDKYWDELEAKVMRWVAQFPNSPTGHNVYASLMIERGWMHRGTSWAKNVKPEDWKPFEEQVSRARTHLMQRKEIASSDPRWYELMLDIARLQSWGHFRFNNILSEAIERYPGFYQIYFLAVDYYVPKWHGNRAEVEKFANLAVSKTKEREDNGMYARIYWYASQTQYTTKLFTDSAVDWKKMSVGIDDVLARYPDQWNINNFANFACLAKDRDKTAALIERMQGAPILRAWNNDISWFNQCKAWAGR